MRVVSVREQHAYQWTGPFAVRVDDGYVAQPGDWIIYHCSDDTNDLFLKSKNSGYFTVATPDKFTELYEEFKS